MAFQMAANGKAAIPHTTLPSPKIFNYSPPSLARACVLV